MESLTKNRKTYVEISEMINKCFKNKSIDRITELNGGLFNAAYEIVLSDDTQIILKIAPSKEVKVMSHEKNIMYTEVEVVKILKEKTDIPLPEILFYDNTKEICDSDYFFMTKIYGICYWNEKKEKNVDLIPEIEYLLGKYNCQINQIKGEKFGYFGQTEKQFYTWREAFTTMLNDVLSDGAKINIDIGVEYDMIKKLLSENLYIFDEVKTPCLVHGDIWDKNVFIKNNDVTGIIDSERALWADKFLEMSFRSDSSNEYFYKGYGIDELTENEKKRIVWYDLYLYLIMTIECFYREYEDSNDIYKQGKSLIIETVNKIQNDMNHYPPRVPGDI